MVNIFYILPEVCRGGGAMPKTENITQYGSHHLDDF